MKQSVKILITLLLATALLFSVPMCALPLPTMRPQSEFS